MIRFSLLRIVLLSIFLLVVFVILFYKSPFYIEKQQPIKCACDYLKANIDKTEIDHYLAVEGINVWREWESLTSSIAGNYQVILDCKIPEYIHSCNMNYHTLEGKMYFVYSMHNYLKNGFVNHKIVKTQVKKNILEIK